MRARERVLPASRALEEVLAIEFRPLDTWRRHSGLSLFKLTSGSSGLPKAVGVPPAVMISDTEQITEALGIRPSDTQIATIPLSHAYGFGNLVLPLFWLGTSIVLHEAFVPQAVMANARTYHARVMPGVPFMFQHFAGAFGAEFREQFVKPNATLAVRVPVGAIAKCNHAISYSRKVRALAFQAVVEGLRIVWHVTSAIG